MRGLVCKQNTRLAGCAGEVVVCTILGLIGAAVAKPPTRQDVALLQAENRGGEDLLCVRQCLWHLV